jgi:hypothetical protein
MPATTQSKPAPAMTASVKRDLKLLASVGAPPGTPVSPLARLSVAQLYEVERMAAQGMNLAQIGVRLRVPEDVWHQYIAMNPDLKEAYEAGAVRGVDVASASVLRAAEAGDIQAARYYLDRLGGPQFAPKNTGPSVVVQTNSVNIDPVSATRAIEHQRMLLDGDYQDVEPEAG